MSHQDPASWEYRVIEIDSITALNTYGAEGWELLGSVDKEKTLLVLGRRGLSFREQVTLDQRRRYFASWNIDIDALDQGGDA